MRITLLSALYTPHGVGGAERVAQMLAEGLVERGHSVGVITTAPDGRARRTTINSVNVDYVAVRNVYRPFSRQRTPNALAKLAFHGLDSWNPFMYLELRRRLGEALPDVVNSHNLTGLSPAAFAAARRAGLPVVHTLHDQYLLCPKTTMFRGRNCEVRCASCAVFSRARLVPRIDLAVGVSDFILRRHHDNGALLGVPNRVIRNPFPTPADRSPPDASAKRPVIFGFLGQIRETKGLHVLIDAFLAEAGDGAELWIGGRGEDAYESRLRQRTQHDPRIRWQGFVDSREFLRSIDVLVVPSVWHDTAPLVVQEAFSAGRPVVGSARGGIPEFVTPATGWIFDPERPGELKAVLRDCIDHRDEIVLRAEAAAKIASSHGLGRFLDEYEAAYREAVRSSADAASR